MIKGVLRETKEYGLSDIICRLNEVYSHGALMYITAFIISLYLENYRLSILYRYAFSFMARA